ncbi:MAG: hypothetical protein GY869_29625, partial [Planctomycetes bacterium]|nr:hypothetical protein [Planctomycetota bacterium]
MMRKRTGLTLFVVTLVMLGMVCGAWGQTTYNVIPGHSIQAAIDGAVYGDTVSVAAGTYLERIMLKNGVAVLGAGEVLTVLDGQTGGTVVTAIDCGDPNTVLAGFTITNGLSVAGGGMYNENSSVTIDHCTFWNNATLAGADGASVYQTSDNGGNGGDGGAMYNSNYNGTITNCSFLVNSTGAGGVGGAGVDTVINSNPGGHGGHGGSGGGGGGMYNTQSTPVLINCIFFGNTTGIGGDGGNGGDSTGAFPGTGGTGGDGGDGGSGAGMCNDNSGPIIINCTMVQNGVGWGGSLGVAGSGDPDGSDGTAGVAGMGGGMYNSAGAPVVTNSIMWGNLPDEIFGGSPSVTYSDVQGGTGEPWFGVGCIDTDPMFVDAGGWDFHLQEISLCLDAGSNSTASLPDEDIDGEDRIMGSSVDMGFDEVVQYELVWLADPTTGGSVVLNPAGGTYFAGTEVTVTA